MNELIVDIKAGATPSTAVKEFWESGTIPWMSSGEINKKIVSSTDKFITKLGYENSSTKLVPPNSVIVALAGQGTTRGKVAINTIELCTNQSLAALIPNSSSHYMFLHYALERRYEELRKISDAGEGRGGLNLELLRNFKISFTGIDEQVKISSVIETIDKRIEVQRKLIEAYESLISIIRTNWIRTAKTVPLKSVAIFVNGYSFDPESYSDKGKYKVITIMNVDGSEYIKTFSSSIQRLPSNIKPNQVLDIGDLLISLTGNVGRVSKISFGDCVLNQRVAKIIPKHPDVKDTIYNALSTNDFLRKMQSLGQGSSQLNIYESDVMEFSIPMANDSNNIVIALTTISKFINISSRMLEILVQLKQELLHVLFI